jgi:hypothetical protein
MSDADCLKPKAKRTHTYVAHDLCIDPCRAPSRHARPNGAKQHPARPARPVDNETFDRPYAPIRSRTHSFPIAGVGAIGRIGTA